MAWSQEHWTRSQAHSSSPFLGSGDWLGAGLESLPMANHSWSPRQPGAWDMGGWDRSLPSQCLPHLPWGLGFQTLALDPAFHLC